MTQNVQRAFPSLTFSIVRHIIEPPEVFLYLYIWLLISVKLQYEEKQVFTVWTHNPREEISRITVLNEDVVT